MYAYNVFAHFRKPGKIIVRLRQEIEGAQIHSKYWPSLSAIPSDRRRYLFFFPPPPKSPLFLRTRPGPALLNYLPCFANTISCINHSNDPSDCQVQESVFFPICLRPGYANPHHTVRSISIEMLQLSAFGPKSLACPRIILLPLIKVRLSIDVGNALRRGRKRKKRVCQFLPSQKTVTQQP